MTAASPVSSPAAPAPPAVRPGPLSFLPTWSMITAKHMELRRRRGLMIVMALFTVGIPVLVLGIRLILHLTDAASYGPAGTPGLFQNIIDPIAQFGFIVAATLGATAGTSDLTEGVFRNLVVTGRSRLALYLARIPAGLSIVISLLAIGFTMICLVTSYAGTSDPTALNESGVNVPLHLSQSQLESWMLAHPNDAVQAFSSGPIFSQGPGGGGPKGGPPNPTVQQLVKGSMGSIYAGYTSDEVHALNPPINEMVKIGLWVALELTIGFMVGLGFGSLIGQRTIATIVMIVLQLVLTPIAANVTIPHFLNGQRLIVGVAMDQLRPAGLPSSSATGHAARRAFAGGGGLQIPLMPTWAMITVIAGWIVVWTIVGAYRMMTRDA